MDVSDRAGCRWTAEKVAADLVEAFRILPTMPVFSPRRSELYPVLPGQDTEALDLVAVSERVLGRKSPERRVLLVWARSKATKGDVGGSVSAYCREAGVNLRTFNRQRRRACAAIAVDLNRQAEDVLATLVDLGGTTPGLAGVVDDAG